MKYLISQLLLTIFILGINISYSQTWIQQPSGTNLNLNSVYFLDVNTGFIGSDSGRVLKTTNSGVNWITITTGFNFNIINAEFFSPILGYAAGNKVIKTTNGGINWTLILDTAFANDVVFWNANTIYIVSTLPHTNKISSNQGVSWNNFGFYNFIHMAVCFGYTNIGWVASKMPAAGGFVSQNISKTTNNGQSWLSQYTGILMYGNGWIYNLHNNDTLNVLAVCNENGTRKILQTSNGGVNWNSTVVTFTQRGIWSNGNPVWWTCGDNGSLMKTMNGGLNWVTEQLSNTSVTLNSIRFLNSETGWMCGSSGSIFKTTNGGITAVQQTSSEIPHDYLLSQNYPNPFNPVTNIKFDLPQKAFTELKIYDQLGRELEILIDKELASGSYKYEWDASKYPSGIYFYKLQAGEFTVTKKMVLVK